MNKKRLFWMSITAILLGLTIGLVVGFQVGKRLGFENGYFEILNRGIEIEIDQIYDEAYEDFMREQERGA